MADYLFPPPFIHQILQSVPADNRARARLSRLPPLIRPGSRSRSSAIPDDTGLPLVKIEALNCPRKGLRLPDVDYREIAGPRCGEAKGES